MRCWGGGGGVYLISTAYWLFLLLYPHLPPPLPYSPANCVCEGYIYCFHIFHPSLFHRNCLLQDYESICLLKIIVLVLYPAFLLNKLTRQFLKWTGYILEIFCHVLQRRHLLWLRVLLSCTQVSFWERVLIDWLCWGLTTRQPLRVILCRLPEKGRKEIEERVEEMKERGREKRGTGKKVKKQKK